MTCCFTATGSPPARLLFPQEPYNALPAATDSPPARPLPTPPQGPYNALPAATDSPPARPLPAPPQEPYEAPLPAATERVVLRTRNWKQIAPTPEPNPPRSFFEAIAAAGSNPNPRASLSHHMFSRGALLSYGFSPPDVEEYMKLQLSEDVNGTPEEKSRFWETYQRHWLSTRWIRQGI